MAPFSPSVTYQRWLVPPRRPGCLPASSWVGLLRPTVSRRCGLAGSTGVPQPPGLFMRYWGCSAPRSPHEALRAVAGPLRLLGFLMRCRGSCPQRTARLPPRIPAPPGQFLRPAEVEGGGSLLQPRCEVLGFLVLLPLQIRLGLCCSPFLQGISPPGPGKNREGKTLYPGASWRSPIRVPRAKLGDRWLPRCPCWISLAPWS